MEGATTNNTSLLVNQGNQGNQSKFSGPPRLAIVFRKDGLTFFLFFPTSQGDQMEGPRKTDRPKRVRNVTNETLDQKFIIPDHSGSIKP